MVPQMAQAMEEIIYPAISALPQKVVQHISSYKISRELVSLLNQERRLALPCPSESYLLVSSGPRLSRGGRHVR